jgi:hypothetical protein
MTTNADASIRTSVQSFEDTTRSLQAAQVILDTHEDRLGDTGPATPADERVKVYEGSNAVGTGKGRRLQFADAQFNVGQDLGNDWYGVTIATDAITATELANNAVDTAAMQDDAATYAKIQNVAADDRILGNIAGAGQPVTELTGSQVGGLINLSELATKDHSNLDGVGTDNHHAKLHATNHLPGGSDEVSLLAFFQGTFLETFDALVTSDGATVTMSLEQSGGGNLTMVFSDGYNTLDCTPADTIALTAGSDSSPTENFVYIPQSTKALTKDTSGWPSVEHIKVGYFLVPSAGFVNTDGVYVNQNWNDHAQEANGLGHLNHMVERMRSQSAIYKSGSALSITVGGGTTVDAAVTAGVIYQMHRHATPAIDTAAGGVVLVVNQNGVAYDNVTDLETLTNDSTGTAVKKYFNWVIWQVGNKGGAFTPLMLNLPNGSYNQLASAEADVSGFDVLTMPAAFNSDSSTGFLNARVTMSKIGGTWAHVSTVDLRGVAPSSVVGGVGSVDTQFADNAFEVFNVSDNTKEMDFDLSGITTGNKRTITMADQDIDLTPNSGTYVGAFSIKTVTAGYTVQLTDNTILCDASGGAFTVTMPEVSGAEGRIFNIKKIDPSANAVTVAAA